MTAGLLKAFNTIISDKNVKSVVIFEKDGKTRTKITKRFKTGHDYLLTIGRPNYSEKLWRKKHQLNVLIKQFPKKK